MNIEKYSERVRGFIQSAQTMALSRNHQQFTPEHLLKVLVDDQEGLAASLIERAGGDVKARAARRRGGAQRAAAASRAATASSTWRSRWPRSSRPPRRWPRRPATASSRSSGCCTALAVEKSAKTADILAKAGVTRAGAQPGDQRHPQGPHRRLGVRRAGLRRAEEIRARPHRGRPRRQARPGHRPRRRNPPHHPGAVAPHQEQSGADRRARRRQDGDRRGPGAAHRQWRRAGDR